jgi:hypothetical protein
MSRACEVVSETGHEPDTEYSGAAGALPASAAPMHGVRPNRDLALDRAREM